MNEANILKEASETYFNRLGDNFKFLTSGKKFVAEFGDTLGDIISASAQINRTFTQNRQRIEEMQYAVADSIPGVMRLGGSFEDIGKTISSIAAASRRNVIANTDSVEKIYAATKILEEDAERLTLVFANIGIGFDKIGKNLEESIAYVQSIGGNATQVMKDVLDNTEKLNKFNFSNGVQGLTKMAAQASMLRFDMRETFNLAEQALKPERAVELASVFQRLGVMSGTLSDPFQLMNQSINDPEGLQNSIVEMTKQFTYFDEKTKSFKISPQGMLTLRQIADEANMSYEELTRMGLAASELDSRLSEINPRITFANEEDKKYLANIASMNERGEYTVNLKNDKGDPYIKRLADVNQEEMNKLIEEQKKGEKPLEQVARDQLTIAENVANDVSAIKNSLIGGIMTSPQIIKTAEKFTQYTETILGGASKKDSGILPVKTVRDYGERGIDTLVKLVTDVTSGQISVVDAFKTFTKSGSKIFGDFKSDAALGGDKYVNSVLKELKEKKLDTSYIESALEMIGAKEGVGDIKSGKKSTVKTLGDSSVKINEEKRLSEYLNENAQNFESLSNSQMKGMSDLTKQFSDMVNKVQNKQASPEDLNNWIKQNKTEIEKYGETYSKTLNKYSEDFSKDLNNTTKKPVNIDTKPIENTLGDNMKKYKEEFDSLVKKVGRGEKSADSLTEYVKNNEKGLKDVGSDFHKGMKNMAEKMSSTIKNDEKKLSEFNKIVDEVKKGTKTETDLKNYFEKNSKDLERIGVNLENVKNVEKGTTEKSSVKAEGKSTFIESTRAVSEPVQSGQVQGGQPLTQVIQHKVDFGKITVDVNLTGTLNQLDTTNQKIILDKVFNDSRFLNLFDMVKKMKPDQLSQTNQLSK